MKVKELIKELKKLDQNADIFVACEGYTNYYAPEDPYDRAFNPDADTNVIPVDGKVFIADECHFEGDKDD